jgi:tetratricopeptide (TPR) repeat protein
MPSERGALHRLAVEIIEEVLEGDTHPYAIELLAHVRGAVAGGSQHVSWALDREYRYLEQAGHYCQRNYEWSRAHDLYSELLDQSRCTGESRIQALRHRGAMRFGMGRPHEALADIQEAAEAADALGDRALIATVLNNLGNVRIVLGQHDAATECFTRSLQIAEELNSTRTLSSALGNLALLRLMQRRPEEARELVRRAMDIEADDVHLQDRCGQISNLARGEREMGNDAEAEALYLKALALAKAYGSRIFESIINGNLAEMHVEQGRLQEAEAEFRRALSIQRESGLARNEAITLVNYALLLRDQGQIEAAMEANATAIELNRKVHNRVNLGIALADRAQMLWLIGNDDAADEHLAVAREHLDGVNQLEFADTLALRMHCGRNDRASAAAVNERIQSEPGVPGKVKAEMQAALEAYTRGEVLYRGFKPAALAPGLRRALLRLLADIPGPQAAALNADATPDT